MDTEYTTYELYNVIIHNEELYYYIKFILSGVILTSTWLLQTWRWRKLYD